MLNPDAHLGPVSYFVLIIIQSSLIHVHTYAQTGVQGAKSTLFDIEHCSIEPLQPNGLHIYIRFFEFQNLL